MPGDTTPETERDYPLRIDRYAVYGELGRGGMARVHLGRLYGAVGFSRIVAFKRMLPEISSDTQHAAALIDEARLGSRIRHPHVVPVLDVVQAPGELALVMDYVHGPSLAWLIRDCKTRGEHIPTNIALRIVIDVLYGLHAAHEAKSERGTPLGLVHRDVSPHNILIGSDGLARIADFGIAKAAGRLARSRAGEIRGKLSYMAPEHLRAIELDRRADVFAVGIVLWELIAERMLFDPTGVRPEELAARILNAPVPSPPKLEAIVMPLLEREPAKRPATAEAAAMLIERSGEPIATHAEVGRWIVVAAAKMLAERDDLVREVEQLSQAFSSEAPDTAPKPVVANVEPMLHTAPLAKHPTELMPPVPQKPSAQPTIMSAGMELAKVAEPSMAPAEKPTTTRPKWLLVVAGILILSLVGAVVWNATTGSHRNRRRGAAGQAQ